MLACSHACLLLLCVFVCMTALCPLFPFHLTQTSWAPGLHGLPVMAGQSVLGLTRRIQLRSGLWSRLPKCLFKCVQQLSREINHHFQNWIGLQTQQRSFMLSHSHYVPTLHSLLSIYLLLLIPYWPFQPFCSHPLAMGVEWCLLLRSLDKFC